MRDHTVLPATHMFIHNRTVLNCLALWLKVAFFARYSTFKKVQQMDGRTESQQLSRACIAMLC